MRHLPLVIECLRDIPHTRDNDTALYIEVIQKAERHTLPSEFTDLLYRYQQAGIVRERAKIQNTLHQYEASDKVRVKRAIRGHKKTLFYRLFHW